MGPLGSPIEGLLGAPSTSPGGSSGILRAVPSKIIAQDAFGPHLVGSNAPGSVRMREQKALNFLGGSWGPLGPLLRCLGALSGASWEPRGASPGNFGRHRSKEGRPRFPSPLCGYENRPWGPLGTFLGRYWAPLVCGASWAPLGALLGHLGARLRPHKRIGRVSPAAGRPVL